MVFTIAKRSKMTQLGSRVCMAAIMIVSLSLVRLANFNPWRGCNMRSIPLADTARNLGLICRRNPDAADGTYGVAIKGCGA